MEKGCAERKKGYAERIEGEFKDRIQDVKKILKAEDPLESLDNLALCLDKYEVYRLELSYGGPQDYLEFEYNPKEKTIQGITYHFLDWFDGATKKVEPDTEEWQILANLFYQTILIE